MSGLANVWLPCSVRSSDLWRALYRWKGRSGAFPTVNSGVVLALQRRVPPIVECTHFNRRSSWANIYTAGSWAYRRSFWSSRTLSSADPMAGVATARARALARRTGPPGRRRFDPGQRMAACARRPGSLPRRAGPAAGHALAEGASLRGLACGNALAGRPQRQRHRLSGRSSTGTRQIGERRRWNCRALDLPNAGR